MKKIVYDVDKIKSAADCRIIAKAYGIPVNGKHCQCVSGLHSESQYNHCEINRDYIYCFSCGFTTDVIGMVRSYNENVLMRSMSHEEACKAVADLLGGSALYEISQNGDKPYSGPLSSEELDVLMLTPKTRHVDGMVPLTMPLLYMSSPRAYYLIAQNAVTEMEQKLNSLLPAADEEISREIYRRLELISIIKGKLFKKS